MPRIILAIWAFLLLSACEPQVVEEPLPFAFVDYQINLSSPSYIKLNTANSYVYLPDQGIRGIIIYTPDGRTYKAFDQNCTFQPSNACATVEVEQSEQYMIDVCCNSIFSFDGSPNGGPARRPLIEYAANVSGGLLYISN